MAAVTGRYLRRFTRTPQMFIFTAVQPVMFVLGLHAAFGGLVAQATGGSYIQYLLPGVIVMNLVFAGGVTSVGIAEDLQAGIVDRFRSLPMNRAAVLVGRTSADFLRNAVGLTMAIASGAALGFRVHGGAVDAATAVVLLLAFSYAVSWLFLCLGIAVRTPQVAQLASFLPALPLTYFSGAWVPIDSIDSSIRAFARNQPINVMIDAVRSLADGTSAGDAVWHAAAWTLGIFVVSAVAAVRLYEREA